MHFLTVVTSILSCLNALVLAQPGTPWVRIDKNDAALLIIDHQLGLFTIVRDQSPVELWNNVLGHAELAKIFNLPAVITSSAEDGPNGKIPEEILTMLPNATVVRRQGEVNAWDSAEFKEAVKATGKKQVILAGITTDVCVHPLQNQM
jgi:nicotinamidase-related amidase